ncbi:MAG: hypothetical protein WC827_03700 [Candidatus Paceibacterota bacterium]|jgi:DNA polymerase III sliding clamp (beta) subunit (PCNA family)
MKKQTLVNALEIVKPGLAGKEVIEQSASFAFMEGRVVTYNDEISISHPVEGLEITGAIQASELYLILKKIKQEEIEIEITNSEIQLTAGRVKVGLTLQQEIKLPLEEIGAITKWKTLPEDFIQAMRMAMFACSSNNSEPILTCVHVNEAGFIEGSDGFRVMRTTLQKKMSVPTFLIPASVVNTLIKLNPVKISSGEGWVHFRTETGTVMSCRVFEESFPDTSGLLEVDGLEFAFPRTINEILDRASIFSKQEGGSLSEDITVVLEKNRIKISSQSDTGWFREEANVKYTEDRLEFNIVPSLLKNILASVLNCTFNGKLLKFVGEGWEFITIVKVSK